MATRTDLVPVRGKGDPDFAALEQLTRGIAEAREDISGRFREIGSLLMQVRAGELYQSAGLASFQDYLALPAIDLNNLQAERLIQMAEAEEVQALLPLGVNKIAEVLRLPPEQRHRLLEGPVEVAGKRKTLPEMSLAELRQVTRDWRQAGKTRCDRCGRWVDQVKEIDGHFYGSGGPHSCYDREMEERRYVTEHPIPAGQLDTVLGTLHAVIPAEPVAGKKKPAHSSLYESINGFLHLYAQLLYHAGDNRPTGDEAKAEVEMLQRTIRLMKVRLQELQG